MARHGVTASAVTALDRLAYMGKRGMGALEFRPARGSHSESAEPLRMKSLIEAARQVLPGDLSDDAPAQAALANIIRVGTSAAGAPAKTVVARNPDKNGRADAGAPVTNSYLERRLLLAPNKEQKQVDTC